MRPHPNDSRVEQSSRARSAIVEMHALANENSDWAKHLQGAELKADYDGDLYISWVAPVRGAIELETYDTEKVTFYTLWRRDWDRTGGVSLEEELGETSEKHIALGMVVAELDYQRERLIRILEEESGPTE